MTTNWRKIETEADLPEEGKDVLTYTQEATFEVSQRLWIDYNELEDGEPLYKRVCWSVTEWGLCPTHWQPLPNPPEGDE